MKFKLKAWMFPPIFVGAMSILSFSAIQDIGFVLVTDLGATIISGIIVGLYYSIKHEWKKWKKRAKPTFKDNVPAS